MEIPDSNCVKVTVDWRLDGLTFWICHRFFTAIAPFASRESCVQSNMLGVQAPCFLIFAVLSVEIVVLALAHTALNRTKFSWGQTYYH
jgi:hypothetical protein